MIEQLEPQAAGINLNAIANIGFGQYAGIEVDQTWFTPPCLPVTIPVAPRQGPVTTRAGLPTQALVINARFGPSAAATPAPRS
jgi:hypothetical protein